LAPGASAADAYIVVTFPPQALLEDAIQAPDVVTPQPYPPWLTKSYGAGSSRVVFKVPAAYGASVPLVSYDLAGVLGLCAQSTTNVAANAAANAGTTRWRQSSAPAVDPVAPNLETTSLALSFNAARVDRVMARHDLAASARLSERAVRLVDP